MFAIATLTFEHRVIERALVALEMLVDEVASTGLDGREVLKNLVDFLTRYADEIHQPKEVGILVAHLVESQQPAAFGPIAAMLGDHTTSRQAIDRLAAAAKIAEQWTATEIEFVAQAAVDLTTLLREHMQQEEALFYDLANKVFEDTEVAKQIEEEFDLHAKETAARAQELSDVAATLVSRWAPADSWKRPTEDIYTRRFISPMFSSLMAG
ncbi:MAG TPA: hemerythrin domain-containing protein [Myxococcales bacterium]|jgi:hemerythrin-like domain-containing protein